MSSDSLPFTLLDLGGGEPVPGGPPRPRQQQCGPLGLRILADGTWLYQGSPIGRKELVKLFSTILSRDAEGVYWMTTPVERGTVEVDDAAFVAVELRVEQAGQPGQTLSFRTNVDQWVVAGPQHRLRVDHDLVTGEPSPYLYIDRGLEAKIARTVFYELVELAVPARDEQDWIGVWSEDIFFPLGQI
ncbi:hypothetical protein SAMN05421779_10922 [Insolitispirillum peregrinum]|uniref:Proteophosphoglycan n=2 Tax=Insolitispirillum peregrinum TaxID=80876 RepID=A0A1N7PZR5_9PROT|nr:hypothetical protein SAMN05421779_10922 [Insolitispirillum peregrinum]